MKRLGFSLLAAACLAACGGGTSSSGVSAPTQSTMTPPAAAGGTVNFTAFTKEVLAVKSDSATPVPLPVGEFVFPDDDNPAAFAAVLSGP